MRKHHRKERVNTSKAKKLRREDLLVPTGPGHRLRIARENCLYTREEVAKQLRLSKQCIASLERDEYSVGAPFIFVRGYLRAYARLVGLPPDEIVSAFDDLALEEIRAPNAWIGQRSEMSLHDRSSRWIMMGVFFGILVLLFLWWELDLVSTTELSKVNSKYSEPLDSVASAPVKSQPLEKRETMPTPVVQTSTEEHLTVAFSEECWIEVYDKSGAKIYYGLKAKGDTLQLAGQSPFQVLLGNPKAVQISMNDGKVDLSRYKNKQTARIVVG